MTPDSKSETPQRVAAVAPLFGGLNWSSEKPKAPGWFWIKDPQGGRAMALVTDINCPGGPYICAFYRGGVEFKRVYDALVGEWQFAGPIPEPNGRDEGRA